MPADTETRPSGCSPTAVTARKKKRPCGQSPGRRKQRPPRHPAAFPARKSSSAKKGKPSTSRLKPPWQTGMSSPRRKAHSSLNECSDYGSDFRNRHRRHEVGGSDRRRRTAPCWCGQSALTPQTESLAGGLCRAARIWSMKSAERLRHRTELTLSAVGVSCGGPLDSRTGIVHAPPNLPHWVDVPLKVTAGS